MLGESPGNALGHDLFASLQDIPRPSVASSVLGPKPGPTAEFARPVTLAQPPLDMGTQLDLAPEPSFCSIPHNNIHSYAIAIA